MTQLYHETKHEIPWLRRRRRFALALYALSLPLIALALWMVVLETEASIKQIVLPAVVVGIAPAGPDDPADAVTVEFALDPGAFETDPDLLQIAGTHRADLFAFNPLDLKELSIGDDVNVRVNPFNPEIATLQGATSPWFVIAFPAAFGLTFTAGAIYLRRRYARLIEWLESSPRPHSNG